MAASLTVAARRQIAISDREPDQGSQGSGRFSMGKCGSVSVIMLPTRSPGSKVINSFTIVPPSSAQTQNFRIRPATCAPTCMVGQISRVRSEFPAKLPKGVEIVANFDRDCSERTTLKDKRRHNRKNHEVVEKRIECSKKTAYYRENFT